jgi:Zn-dependent protease with chaperone function
MENKIEYWKIAAKLTLVWLIFSLVAALLIGGINLLLSKNATLLMLPLVIIGMYMTIGWYIRKNSKKWNITIVKGNGVASEFSGLAFAAIMYGVFWRSAWIGVFTKAVRAMLNRMYENGLTSISEYGIDFVLILLPIYLAFYWILKVQYGGFKIVNLPSNQSITALNK